MRTRSPIQPHRGDENLDGFSERSFHPLFGVGLLPALLIRTIRTMIGGIKR